MFNLDIPGWMSEQEMTVISEIAAQVPENGVIVELGSYKGKSALVWASFCHPSVKVYCIDLFASYTTDEPDFFEEFRENTKHLPNIIQIRGLCPILLDYPGDPIDVFFNDAVHYNPMDWNNIQYFKKYIKPGGLLVAHDYIPETYPDVVENASRLEAETNNQITQYSRTCLYSIRM